MDFDHSMDDRNRSAIGVEHNNVASVDGRSWLVEKKDIPSREAWFHAATENDDDGRFAASEDDEGFPNDECRCYYQACMR